MRKGRGEIKKVSDLFEKYRKTLIAPQRTVIITFIEVVDEVIGIKLDQKAVRYAPASRTLSVTAGGPLKSELRLHKDELIAHMKGRLGEKNAPTTIL
ncbi:MAG: hypothetical protein WDZ93_03970 [Candidatus Paceibacterota bacterium]